MSFASLARASSALLLITVSLACTAIDNPNLSDETGSSTNGDGDGDGDGDGTTGDGDGEPLPTTTTANDGSEMCEPGDVCVDGVLSGWEGPVAVYVGPVGEPLPSCEAGVPTKVAEVFTDLQDPSPGNACGCDCGPLTDYSCTEATLEASNQGDCRPATDEWNLEEDDCVDLGSPISGLSFRVDPPALASATCSPSITNPVEEAFHGQQIVACAVDESAQDCADGGVCMPPTDEAPWDGRVCIIAAGDVPCPSGSYGVHNVYYMGVNDTRSCDSCACGPAPGETCPGHVNLLSNACGIQGLLIQQVDNGQCEGPVNDAVEFAQLKLDPYTGECASSGGGVSGSVSETGALTFCCQ